MCGAFVAVLVIDLHFPDAGSLKGKRKELAPIKAQLRQRLGVSVAEVDHHNLWQRATLAGAIACGSAHEADEAADRVQRWLEAHADYVTVDRTIASVTDLQA
jgi:uncharacterized protein YlxP (DUF503 family)